MARAALKQDRFDPMTALLVAILMAAIGYAILTLTRAGTQGSWTTSAGCKKAEGTLQQIQTPAGQALQCYVKSVALEVHDGN